MNLCLGNNFTLCLCSLLCIPLCIIRCVFQMHKNEHIKSYFRIDAHPLQYVRVGGGGAGGRRRFPSH